MKNPKNKKSKKDESDPAWSRSLSKKAGKTSPTPGPGGRPTRGLYNAMVMQKKAAQKMQALPTCVTRTVELPSTREVGNESSKLLFMLALGLTPKIGKISSSDPFVRLEKMDPTIEAEAKSRTRDVIFKIFRERKREQLQLRIALPSPSAPVNQTNPSNLDDVELVNLASSSEDESSCEDGHVVRLPTVGRNDRTSLPMTTTIPTSRKPVFKLMTNNQEQSGIFRNWKPESMSSFIARNKSEGTAAANSKVVAKLDAKFLSSLKSVPKNSTLTINNFSSKAPIRAAQLHKKAVEASSEYILPDKQPIITID